MTSDTARRLAEEKYPTTRFPSSPGERQRLRDHEESLRAAFLAGWDAREVITEEMVEAAARARADLIRARYGFMPLRDDEFKSYLVDRPDEVEEIRAALSAALGGDS